MFGEKLQLEPLEDRILLATCHVTRLTDQGTGQGFRGDLRYCINKANTEPGRDVIDFKVTGTIILSDDLPALGSDIDVVGPGARLLTVRAANDFRIFTIASGTVLISGLTVSNGGANVGGAVYNQATLTLKNASIESSIAYGGVGGGIYNAGIITLNGSILSDNRAQRQKLGFGGGLYNESGAIATLVDS